jgi:hypothetical protein
MREMRERGEIREHFSSSSSSSSSSKKLVADNY